MEEWVLPDRNSYERRAIQLANDPATPAMLAVLRSGLRTSVARSAACDTERACRSMEALYFRIAGGTDATPARFPVSR
jgi:predicted O-linked N-acetylglucosamine transferase (SPINDLY family)